MRLYKRDCLQNTPDSETTVSVTTKGSVDPLAKPHGLLNAGPIGTTSNGSNADLERKVLERTHNLTDTLEQLEQSKEELGRVLDAERKLGEMKSRLWRWLRTSFVRP